MHTTKHTIITHYTNQLTMSKENTPMNDPFCTLHGIDHAWGQCSSMYTPAYKAQEQAIWQGTVHTTTPTTKGHTMYTHTKLTLTTTTTMRWLVLLTLNTLMCMALTMYLPWWSGLHALAYVGTTMSLMATLGMGITHCWVRAHHTITLSTRNMGN